MNNPPPAGSTLVSYVPLFIAVIMFAVMILIVAPRKGKSLAFALFAFVPFVNIIVVVWLLSLTDKSVLDAIKALKDRA